MSTTKIDPKVVNIASLFPPIPENKFGWPWNTDVSPFEEKMSNGMEWPRISVTIPSLNQEEYLEEAIRSVLLQGYPNIELFVMDGGSKDNSKDILEKYSMWIDGWQSNADHGQSHAINKGWEKSSGHLISYLPSDDMYQPGAFRNVAEAWAYQQDVVLITGAIQYIDTFSKPIKVVYSRIAREAPLDLSLMDIGDWYIAQQASFFTKSYLDKVGRWLREDLHYVMDRELMYRLCREGKILILQETIAADRVNPLAKRHRDTLKMYREDRVALNYCNWGTDQEKIKKKQVANQRLAQGYWKLAESHSRTFWKIYYKLMAVVISPGFIKKFKPIKKILPIFRTIKNKLLKEKQI